MRRRAARAAAAKKRQSRRSSPSTSRRCCSPRSSGRFAPTACSIRCSRRRSFRRSRRRSRRSTSSAARACARVSCSLELENQDLAGAAAESQAGARAGGGHLRDDREGDGAAGAAEGGARRRGRRRTRSTRSRRSSTAASASSRKARSRRRTSTTRRSTSPRRATSTRSRESVSRTCRRFAQDQALKAAAAQRDAAKGAQRGRAGAARLLADHESDRRRRHRPPVLRRARRRRAARPIVTVMDLSQVIARAHVSQAEAAELKVGNDANLIGPGGAPIPGKVTQISPALDAAKHDGRSLGAGATTRTAAEAGHEPARRDDREGRCRTRSVIPQAAVLTSPSGATSVDRRSTRRTSRTSEGRRRHSRRRQACRSPMASRAASAS